MPSLPNYRWELFARGVASGLSLTTAYKNAGFEVTDEKNVHAYSSRLGKNTQVQARIAEIMADHARSIMIDRQYVVGKLVENIEKCMVPTRKIINPDGTEETTTYNPAAANKAIELLGKELGMFVDRQERGAPGEFANLNNSNDLREIIARRLGMARESDSEAFVSGGERSSRDGYH
jgi:hypothetical protein